MQSEKAKAASSSRTTLPSPTERWLLLHGTPLSPEVWMKIENGIAAHGGAVSTPDLRGRGDSATCAAQLDAELDDGAVHVVGHSFGGQVAIDLALHHPEKVASLTLICSRATPFPAFADAATSLRRDERPSEETAIARWFTPEERRAGGELLDYVHRRLQSAPLRDWANALDSIASFDRLHDLAMINVPLVAVAAEFDQVSTPHSMRELATRTSGRFILLRGTSHMGPFLRPDRMIDLLFDAPASRQAQEHRSRSLTDRPAR
jgi:pimeloyl-ACP methyl ester carboxylesterase